MQCKRFFLMQTKTTWRAVNRLEESIFIRRLTTTPKQNTQINNIFE